MKTMRWLAAILTTTAGVAVEPVQHPLLKIKRVHIEKLSGDQSAAQIRDMIINALQSASLFVVTEIPTGRMRSCAGRPRIRSSPTPSKQTRG